MRIRYVHDRHPADFPAKLRTWELLIARKWWIDGFSIVTPRAIHSLFFAG